MAIAGAGLFASTLRAGCSARRSFLLQAVYLRSNGADDEASSRLTLSRLQAQERHAGVEKFSYFVLYYKLDACHGPEIITHAGAGSIVYHITHFTNQAHVQYFTQITH